MLHGFKSAFWPDTIRRDFYNSAYDLLECAFFRMSKLFFLVFITCIIFCVCICMRGRGGTPQCLCESQGTTSRSQFSSSLMWDLGMEHMLSGLAASAFILQAILLARVNITDIYWAVPVGELSNLPALSLWMLQSVLWIGHFIFISLHLMQMKNEIQGKCVIFRRSHIAHLHGLGLNPGSQMNRSYVCIISAFHHHYINIA